MQMCPNCGYNNRPGTVFCENCGTSLIGGETRKLGGTRELDEKILEQYGLDKKDIDQPKQEELPAGSKLRLSIEEESKKEFDIHQKKVIQFGRSDATSGVTPEVDLTEQAGYRKGVSRRHAEIRLVEGNRLELWDMGSSNGSFLNGERLISHRAYPLHDGDEIYLGQLKVKVEFVMV
jgi:pSer/pThr/pTyr-binding forkhead associated (FHA) protein